MNRPGDSSEPGSHESYQTCQNWPCLINSNLEEDGARTGWSLVLGPGSSDSRLLAASNDHWHRRVLNRARLRNPWLAIRSNVNDFSYQSHESRVVLSNNIRRMLDQRHLPKEKESADPKYDTGSPSYARVRAFHHSPPPQSTIAAFRHFYPQTSGRTGFSTKKPLGGRLFSCISA